MEADEDKERNSFVYDQKWLFLTIYSANKTVYKTNQIYK